jgi:hypothetical protein
MLYNVKHMNSFPELFEPDYRRRIAIRHRLSHHKNDANPCTSGPVALVKKSVQLHLITNF